MGTRKISPIIIVKPDVPGLSARSLSSFVLEAGRAALLRGTVTVLVTSNRKMRDLNQRFRGKPFATDVLSFPPPTFVEGFAGDIAVSREIAARNARSMGHATADEVKVLVLHGILHLAGYDHERDNGEMATKEARLRRRFGLPESLIQRAQAKHGRAARAVSSQK